MTCPLCVSVCLYVYACVCVYVENLDKALSFLPKSCGTFVYLQLRQYSQHSWLSEENKCL